jgi:hypothetical protein
MVSKKGIVEQLAISGYPLELFIKEILLNDGWLVWPNQYYLDKDDGQAREYDIRAEKQIYMNKNDSALNFILLIQCKKILGNAWVFFGGPQTRAYEHSIVSFPKMVTLLDAFKVKPSDALSEIAKPLLDKHLHYDSGFISSGYAELVMNVEKSKKSGNHNLWESEITLIKVVDSVSSDCLSHESMRYSMEDLEDQGSDKWFGSGAAQSIFFLFPIIIFEGDMCSVKLPLVEENVKEENYVKLFKMLKSEHYNFSGTIDVVTKGFFENYLKLLNDDINNFTSTVEENWTNFTTKEKELLFLKSKM